VPEAGEYEVILNSDSSFYSGSNAGGPLSVTAEDLTWMNRPASIQLTLPPLAGLVLKKKV